eukprot:7120929-Prymnesium_polylepis.1
MWARVHCRADLQCEFAERRNFYTEYVHFWASFGIRIPCVFHSRRIPTIPRISGRIPTFQRSFGIRENHIVGLPTLRVTGWDQLGPAGTGWDRLGPAGTGWDRMDC